MLLQFKLYFGLHMMFHLIDLSSQVYAVEQLLTGKSKPYILNWLQTKGRITRKKTLSSELIQVYEFRSYFELRSHICFNTVFFIEEEQFIFLGEHRTFRPHQL